MRGPLPDSLVSRASEERLQDAREVHDRSGVRLCQILALAYAEWSFAVLCIFDYSPCDHSIVTVDYEQASLLLEESQR